MTTTTTPAANTASPTTSTSNPTPATPTASSGGKLERIAEGLNNVVTSLGNTASVAGEGAKLRWRALESYIHDNQDYIKLIWLWMPFVCLAWICFWEYAAIKWAIYPLSQGMLEVLGYGLPFMYFLVIWYLPNNVLLALAHAIVETLDKITGRDDFNVESARVAIRDRIRIIITICAAGLALRPFAPTGAGLLYCLLPFGCLALALVWTHEKIKSRLVNWPMMLGLGGLMVGYGLFHVYPYMTNHFVECRKPSEDSWFAKKDNKYSKFFADTSASGWKMETMVMPGVSTMGATIASTAEGTIKTALDGHLYIGAELGTTHPTRHIKRCFTLIKKPFDPVTSPLGMKLEEPSLDSYCRDLMMVNEVTSEDVERVANDKWSWDDSGNVLKESSLKRLTSNAHTQAIIRSNLKVATDPACWIGTNDVKPNYCVKAMARRTVSAIVAPGFSFSAPLETIDGFSLRCLISQCDTLMLKADDLRVYKSLGLVSVGMPVARVPVDVGTEVSKFVEAAKSEANDINYAMCTNHPAYDSFSIADWEDKAPNAVKNERDWSKEAETNPALQSVSAGLAKVKAIEAGPSTLAHNGSVAKEIKAWGHEFQGDNAWFWLIFKICIAGFMLMWLFGAIFGALGGVATKVKTLFAATEKASQIVSDEAKASGVTKAGGGGGHAPKADHKPKGGGGHAPAPHH